MNIIKDKLRLSDYEYREFIDIIMQEIDDRNRLAYDQQIREEWSKRQQEVVEYPDDWP